jgi:hypothetical protein
MLGERSLTESLSSTLTSLVSLNGNGPSRLLVLAMPPLIKKSES